MLLCLALLCSAAWAAAAPSHRNYVYSHLLRDGTAPNWSDFARDFGLSRAGTDAALAQLAADHDVVLLPHVSGTPSRNYILMAHPFSNLPTCHTAAHDRDAVSAALAKLVRSVPCLLPRTFLRTPRALHYGN